MSHDPTGPMRPDDVYNHLQSACRLLERAEDHAIAALVSQCMALVHARYGVGRDHLEEDGGER